MRVLLPLLLLLPLLPAGCCRTRRCPRPRPAPLAPVAPASAAPAPTWPSAAERTLAPGQAPTPYTAAQIRDGCPTGRTIRFRLEAEGAPPMVQVIRFVETEAAGAVLEVGVLDTEGRELAPPKRGAKQTWSALQAHGSFPAAQTQIAEETIETPAGRFACLRYTVTQPRADVPRVRRYWFARSLPGPPVRYEARLGGEVVSRMELLESRVEVPGDQKSG